ncbi:GtrA family protein [Helicobacter saguini]|uniref:GtrA family protein n=1 Tax=Helicobacter saguini TaxID=1548018 RepID=A0A347W7E3_9HELI|nr:GtrA family protein [Helicobacter saguini]MWV61333.1 GtrA family protein [Helicobacter saguini]MWV67997.1 GtrA family protein [Helicobacter saguini]MWV70535.1 GtrA family protein [Helicobacter saguini]MWV72439.1 GtrA family protein [Helicobacter saguini]TLD94801.1 GtrA family protein [Helicobacter saguini]
MIKKLLNNTAIKYALVGVVNTCVGFGITILLTFLGIIPEIANVIGNAVGILNSYILNKKFTFKSQNTHKRDFTRFIIAMGISYLANLAALSLCYRILHIDKYISLVIAAVIYTITGYLISKLWAFKQKDSIESSPKINTKEQQ